MDNFSNRDARFLVRLVRQQDAAGDVADGIDAVPGQSITKLMVVDLHETFFIQLTIFGVFQRRSERSALFGTRPTASQHPVIKFAFELFRR